MEVAEAVDPPSPIAFDSIVMGVCCHPQRDIIAVGDIDGHVSVHDFALTNSKRSLMDFSHHKKSCRRVRFNVDGSLLVTASKDKSFHVIDMSAGTVTKSVKDAHKSAIFSLLVVTDNIIATGDDEGTLKLWDTRQQSAVMEMSESDDYLSDMIADEPNKTLLVTSGEGTLTAFDIRKHKLLLQSELLDSGLLSITTVRNGAKVVCGTEEGVLDIFNWGQWGNISDRFPGHPMSVDCIVTLSDSVVCTGASDGVIRAVSILPNRIIGTVGEHHGFPIEDLSMSRCGRWLASCSHDQLVKFSDVREVPLHKVDGHTRLKRSAQAKVLSSKAAAESDFFSDLEPDAIESVEPQQSESSDSNSGDDDDDDGDDDDDDDVDNEDDSDEDCNNSCEK